MSADNTHGPLTTIRYRERTMAAKNSTALRKLRHTWYCMWRRCSNPKDKDFHRYGARGISVCDRWRSFENFYADMGDRPSGKTLDRINNDGPYSPENCRWSTTQEQCRNRRSNRRLSVGGESLLIVEWAERAGLDQRIVNNRLWNGVSIERAVLPGTIRVRGEQQHLSKLKVAEVVAIRSEHASGKSCASIARKYGVDKSTIDRVCRRLTWKHVP